MSVASTDLPTHCVPARHTGMLNEIEQAQLCQWLNAVAQNRDKQAFTRLFHFFAPKIQRIAFGKFHCEAQANEVVQETMSNLWRKAHLFDDTKGVATTWVYTVMRNVTFDMLRKVKANREDNLSDDIWPLADASYGEENSVEGTYVDHLAKGQLLSVIEQLPENQQQVIKGFYLMEMSQEQLAEHLQLPLGTVKSRLRLALAKLKLQLGKHHD